MDRIRRLVKMTIGSSTRDAVATGDTNAIQFDDSARDGTVSECAPVLRSNVRALKWETPVAIEPR